ncbi:Collagen alpha-1(XXVII) chain [Trichinella spiralis]|uniref:Collagen alpha-1(XXVII) chain n=1 Tax=Trichinella spiralis TaxID=6334 RepID=A0ABR3K1C3_TRISP
MINQLERRSALLVLLLPALIAAADHPRTIRHRRESEFLEGLGGPIALKPKNKTDSVEKLLSTESELLSTETLLLINKSTTQEELISTTPITTPSPTTTASTTSTISAATTAEAAAKKVTETPPITKETKEACTTTTTTTTTATTTTKPRPIPKSKSPPTTTTMATAKAPRLSTERKKSQSQTSSVNRSKEYTTPPCASSLILNGFYICNRANRPRCCNKSPTTNHENNNNFLQSFKEDLMNDIKKQLEVFKKQIVSMIQYRKVAKS